MSGILRVLGVVDDHALLGPLAYALKEVRERSGHSPALELVGCLDAAMESVGAGYAARHVVVVAPRPRAGEREPERLGTRLRPLCLARPEVPVVLLRRTEGRAGSAAVSPEGVLEVRVAPDELSGPAVASYLWPVLSGDGLDGFRRRLPEAVGGVIPFALSILLHRKVSGGGRASRRPTWRGHLVSLRKAYTRSSGGDMSPARDGFVRCSTCSPCWCGWGSGASRSWGRSKRLGSPM